MRRRRGGFDTVVGVEPTTARQGAKQLPPGRRHELVAEIRSHVADALAAVGDDEASVRGVLDRLGDREDIVAAEAEAVPSAQPVAPFQSGPVRPISAWGPLEIIAVVGLTIGAVVVPGGRVPLVGLVCAWASARAGPARRRSSPPIGRCWPRC